MKTPITYYGGKQNLAELILRFIPEHTLYCEPFVGGAAIFFAKPPSEVEVINDVNKELINFYRVVQNDFVSLEREIRISLHSRDLYRQARVIYNNPDMFNEIKRAWAVWLMSTQGFASMFDNSWGYDVSKSTTTTKVSNKRNSFTEDYAIRLQNVQLECTDALRIIRSRDNKNSFFYCDPPYYNSDCGHYDGYSAEDYESLLHVLSEIKGKFLLSSYPSVLLDKYSEINGWYQHKIEQPVSVANNSNSRKRKIEVLTVNYNVLDLNSAGRLF